MLRIRIVVAAAVVLVSIGCGGDATTSTPTATLPTDTTSQRQRLLITSGRGFSDTVDASVQSVTVNVAAQGGRSHITELNVTCESRPGETPGIYTEPDGSTYRAFCQVRQPQVVTTDANGNATIPIVLGFVAGHWLLRVYEFGSNDSDTISFTVWAGHPALIRVAPHDTAVTAGNAVQLTAATTDRHGNLAANGVSYSVDSAASSASVTSDGRVAGSAPGRARIRVRLTGTTAEDTARVSVVPNGVIAAVVSQGLSTDGLATFNTDGSNLRMLSSLAKRNAFPSWSPDASAIVYNVGESTGLLYRVDTNHVITKLSMAGAFPSETWPRYSYDGQFIYFTGGSYPDSLDTYRMRADGTGPRVQVTPKRAGSTQYWRASPSPDGRQLAYSVSGQFSSAIHVYTFETNSDRTIDTNVPIESNSSAINPRFSPDGQWIAFVEPNRYSLRVIRPDGTGLRTLTGSYLVIPTGHDWSPDGTWIVCEENELLLLVRVSDALVIPLPYARNFINPSWRPR
jgi:hypothetical protein